MPQRPRKPALELPHFNVSIFDDVNTVRRAIVALENGVLDMAAMVVDAMTRDDRIGACLGTRTQAIPALDTAFEPTKTTSDECQEWFSTQWKQIFPDPAVAELSAWGIMLGVGFAQNIWTNEDGSARIIDGKLTPRLKIWHPRDATWRSDTRGWWMNTVDGPKQIRHGDGEWVIYTPRGVDRAFMKGHVRQLFVPWLARQWGHRDWARLSEVSGIPTRKAFVPAGSASEDKERFRDEVAALGNESTVYLPRAADGADSGFDIELLEVTSTSYEGFDKLIERLSTNIAVNLLGQNLTTEVKGGSLAAAGVHERIANGILKADGSSLSECLQTGTMDIAAELNFGDANKRPKVSYKTEPPEDKKLVGESMKAVGEGIGALVKAGFPVDGEKVAFRLGIPLIDGKHYEQQEPEPAVSPGGMPPPSKPKPGAKPKGGKRGQLAIDDEEPLQGQLFVDELADEAVGKGQEIISGNLSGLLVEIEAATDFNDMRRRLVKAYGAMKPEKLEKVMRAALTLSELNGRHAAREEVGDEA